MTAEQLQELLSPKEYEILNYLGQGKNNKDIAQVAGVAEGTIKALKSRIKKKLGNDFVNHLTNQKSPGAELVLFEIQRDNLPTILSELEYKVFLELEKSIKSYSLIAEEIETTVLAVKSAVNNIKKKIGYDFQRLFEKQIYSNIHDTYAQPSCQNCVRFINEVHNNGTKTIYCQIHGMVTFPSRERYSCEWHKTYINKKYQERDFLEEKLSDKGYLQMAFNRYAKAQDKPLDTEEKLQLGINGLGHMNVLLTKRAKHFATMAQMTRYAVVPLSTFDLSKGSFKEAFINENGKKKTKTRYPVKELLDFYRLKPIKTEQDIDERGQKYSVGYYVIKKIFHLRSLTALLIGNVNITIPEQGTLAIEFERETLLQGVYCKKEGEESKSKLNLDALLPQKIHTAKFHCNPGKYIIYIALGNGRNDKWGINLSYEVEVISNNGTCRIESQRLTL